MLLGTNLHWGALNNSLAVVATDVVATGAGSVVAVCRQAGWQEAMQNSDSASSHKMGSRGSSDFVDWVSQSVAEYVWNTCVSSLLSFISMYPARVLNCC